MAAVFSLDDNWIQDSIQAWRVLLFTAICEKGSFQDA